jgi:spermidine synthase
MEGLHLTADLQGCRCGPSLLTDPHRLAQLCTSLTVGAGLTVVAQRWHKFPDIGSEASGVTGMLLLAESHLAIHTWPETGGVTLDVYVCNFTGDNSAKAREVLAGLEHALQPTSSRRQQLARGMPHEAPAPADDGVFEHLNDESFYGFRFERRLLSTRTQHQKLELLESPQLGRTLRLDGRFMTSEADEFFYHEALVHPAALAHPRPERVLIIGGGDGGAAEEVLKHPTVRHVTLVELDAQVVEVARSELAGIHRGALDDPRVRVLCEDGSRFVQVTGDTFDLVRLDLTDPQTPAGPLYTQAFMASLKRIVAPGGAVVFHLGAPFFHGEQVGNLLGSLRRTFQVVSPYGLHIPLYGAYWGMAVAADRLDPLSLTRFELAGRLQDRGIADLRYYNAQVHDALFALPNFYRDLFAGEATPGAAAPTGASTSIQAL